MSDELSRMWTYWRDKKGVVDFNACLENAGLHYEEETQNGQ